MTNDILLDKRLFLSGRHRTPLRHATVQSLHQERMGAPYSAAKRFHNSTQACKLSRKRCKISARTGLS